MKYKLRAECGYDLLLFNKLLSLCITSVRHTEITPGLPDMEMEFESSMSLDELREAIDLLPDSHVMAETLAPLEQYTGHRKTPNP